jgi:hypothetical protein
VSHHNLPFDESGFDFLKYTPHPLSNQTVGFAYTFGWAKQRGKQPPKSSNLFRIL